jgi:hypothetical protein
MDVDSAEFGELVGDIGEHGPPAPPGKPSRRHAPKQNRVAIGPKARVLRMETSIDPPAGQDTPGSAEPDYHPAAALFPLLPVDSQEFGDLVRDVREHGLLQSIVLHEGKILDGRNRHRACRHAGIEPRYVEWNGESPTAYVVRACGRRGDPRPQRRAGPGQA